MITNRVQAMIRRERRPEKAEVLARYFKTASGQYGYQDQFLGISVPRCRQLAKKFFLPAMDLRPLLHSSYHEERLIALLMLIQKYQTATPGKQRTIARFYLGQRRAINNWDLVDLSAPQILGDYFWHNPKEKTYLDKLATSRRLWDRRMAILSTLAFIRQDDFTDTLRLAEMYLNDAEDLIQKATGWMLREVGKRDQAVLVKFLMVHSKQMPRTMLRYSLEKFPEAERQHWLKISRPEKKNF